jgi:hypothetical protein
VTGDARQTRSASDRGSTIPLILLCVLVALLLVAGAITTGSAFLARRDLQSDCDAAAVAGANGLDSASLYGSPEAAGDLPLADAAVAAAVERYRAEALPADRSLSLVATTDGATVRVDCRRVVDVPFGTVWGVGDGLDCRASSTARAHVRS